ncbi:MAG: cytochrome c biogenesis protein ResB, partial [Candidatus Firestonebacteria bacterium]|nr:cytochrome c biogenesis protein ResB [Candidatus Firestonebacteria bacterium]
MFENTKIYPFWKFFTKIKLGLFLILILAVVSGINTFYSAPDRESLGIEIYHSWWYITILIILFINILVCSLDRLPNTFILTRYNKEKNIFIDKEIVSRCDVHSEINNPLILPLGNEDDRGFENGYLDNKFNKILDNLIRKHYYIINKENYIWAEKGKIRYWGSYLTHLGIL